MARGLRIRFRGAPLVVAVHDLVTAACAVITLHTAVLQLIMSKFNQPLIVYRFKWETAHITTDLSLNIQPCLNRSLGRAQLEPEGDIGP